MIPFRRGQYADRTKYGQAGLLACMALSFMVGCQAPEPQACPVPAPEQQAGPATPTPIEAPIATEIRPAISPPAIQSLTLGESVQGRPIELYVFGEGGETTLIIGGIHGTEPTSHELAIELIHYLKDHPEVYHDRCVMVAPSVNPDGLATRNRRNANGVDINRNFPASNFPAKPDRRFAGGRAPLSEPESRAIMVAIEHARPAKLISIHSITRGRHGNNYDGPARELAEEMSRYNGYPILPTMGYPTPGSLGSWAGVDRGLPTITLELPRDADGPTCWAENRDALLAAIRLPMRAVQAVDAPVLGK